MARRGTGPLRHGTHDSLGVEKQQTWAWFGRSARGNLSDCRAACEARRKSQTCERRVDWNLHCAAYSHLTFHIIIPAPSPPGEYSEGAVRIVGLRRRLHHALSVTSPAGPRMPNLPTSTSTSTPPRPGRHSVGRADRTSSSLSLCTVQHHDNAVRGTSTSATAGTFVFVQFRLA